MAYEGFLEANDSNEKRITALLSATSPDPKGIALWAMGPGIFYTRSIFNSLDFDHAIYEHVTPDALWGYFNGTTGRTGSLTASGFVSFERHRTDQNEEYAYRLTDAGEDFGKPAAALAARIVTQLDRKTKYSSMLRILGTSNSTGKIKRPYTVFRVIEELIRAGKPLRLEDLVEITGLNKSTLSGVLESLGNPAYGSGIIDYVSPQTDSKGKKGSGWAVYKANKNIEEADSEDVLEEVKDIRKRFAYEGDLTYAIDFIKANKGKEFTGRNGEEIGVPSYRFSSCLSILSDLGYMDSTFVGRRNNSRASVNDFTRTMWNKFLAPVGEAITSMDPSNPAFRSALEHYSRNSREKEHAIQRQLELYDTERYNVSDRSFLDVLILGSVAKGQKKLSHIREDAAKSFDKKLGKWLVQSRMKTLVRTGRIESLGNGYYGLRKEEEMEAAG